MDALSQSLRARAAAPGHIRVAGPSALRWTIAAAVAGAVTVLWRLLTFTGFSNDHYVHLARAQQMLLGAWPVRDFVDPGMPLTYAASALGRLAFGEAMRSEFIVVAAGFAVGAAATAVCALRLAPSLAVAAAVVAVQVQASPRTYSYPKILLYGLAGLVLTAVAADPSRRRVALAALMTVVAFLFRHDHGLYIGVSCAVCVVAATLPQWRLSLRRLLLFGVVAGILLLPWAVFVERYEGLVPYFASGVAFSGREADVTILRAFPRFSVSPLYSPGNAQAWLVYLFLALPVAGGALALRRRMTGREAWTGEAAGVLGISVMALVADWGFLRDPIGARIPDAVAPASLLGAWLLGVAWATGARTRGTRVLARAAAAAVLAVTATAMWQVAETTELLDRAGILDGTDAVVSNFGEALDELGKHESEGLRTPSRISGALLPFFHYLDDCTAPTDRLMVTGQFPDVFVTARRGFAGGQVAFMEGFYVSGDEQRLTLARLRKESVPFVLLVLDAQPVFERNFPLLNAHLAASYDVLFDLPVPDTAGVRVLVERGRVPVRRYAQTSWPCFQ